MTTYKHSGVDVKKAGKILSEFSEFQCTRPRDPRVVTGIGPFASCYRLSPVLNGLSDPLLATSCDGVGTKSMLALQWGELEHLGQDLVAMNVNDLLCVGAVPLLFLDYYACGSLRESQLFTILKSIQSACEQARCALVGGETAEMPGLYRENDFDLAGFAVGVVDKHRLLGAERVREGSVLIALESSGFHSNGYSLIRKLVEKERIRPDASALDFGKTWREVLLEPTCIYVAALSKVSGVLEAAAHLTGGGLFENLVRVIPNGHVALIESLKWPISPLFEWAQRAAGISLMELLSTFNCGVGMILVVGEAEVSGVLQSVGAAGTRAWVVGHVRKENGSAPEVRWV